jgi:DNA primase
MVRGHLDQLHLDQLWWPEHGVRKRDVLDSVRPAPAVNVAVPLRWGGGHPDLDPQTVTMDVALERDGDPFEPVLHGRQLLRPALRRLAA